jgi:translation elongation factor EF-4
MMNLTRERAGAAIAMLSRLQTEGDGNPTIHDIDNENENALKNSRKIDDCFETDKLVLRIWTGYGTKVIERDKTEEQVRNALARDYEADISRTRTLRFLKHWQSICSYRSGHLPRRPCYS